MSLSVEVQHRERRSLKLITIAIILLMFSSNRILYVRYIPLTAIYIFIFFSFIIYLRYNFKYFFHTSKFTFFCIITLSFVWLYDQFWLNGFNVISIWGTLLTITCAMIILNAPLLEKKYMMHSLIKTVQLIVGVALVGWLLFLFRFPLPHFTDLSDSFYIHTVYYVFNINGYPDLQFFPRFAGPFLEPGHLGTMCVFLLYIENFNLKNLGNIILLLGILFSLSLAAYGLMIGAIILTLINRKKWFGVVGIISFFILIGLAAMAYNNGDNPINEAIVLRLEMNDNGEIAGNNRTSGAFDSAYDKFLKSNDIWMGVGRKAFGIRGDGSDNITIGCATYKRYFFLRGVLGSLLILAFIFLYYYKYRNRKGLGLVIVYIVANCIRDYPTMEMWMYFYLLAIPIIGKNHCQNRYKIK